MKDQIAAEIYSRFTIIPDATADSSKSLQLSKAWAHAVSCLPETTKGAPITDVVKAAIEFAVEQYESVQYGLSKKPEEVKPNTLTTGQKARKKLEDLDVYIDDLLRTIRIVFEAFESGTELGISVLSDMSGYKFSHVFLGLLILEEEGRVLINRYHSSSNGETSVSVYAIWEDDNA